MQFKLSLKKTAIIATATCLICVIWYAKTPTGTAHFLAIANRMGLSEKVMCVHVPEVAEFGELNQERFKVGNPSLSYTINPQHLHAERTNETATLKQRFVPSEKGSERVIAVFKLKPRNTYAINQKVFFEPNFDWGGTSESGKFGFGFGGGTAPTGGTTDMDGFTVRPAWQGLGNGQAHTTMYVYSADRTQNLPYGDEHVVPEFEIPIGEWFDLSIRATVNTELDQSDGELIVTINDKVLLHRENIQWQSEGNKPSIDRLIFSSFHGGSSAEWKPDSEGYAQFQQTCVFD